MVFRQTAVFDGKRIRKTEEKSLKTMGFSDFCELTGSVVGLNDNFWMALFKSSFGLQEQSVAQPVYFF